ncbi:MAG TPA: adenylate/guanylate cyclase domain-containing protein [Acidimicrobiia bacterium]|nr:adenylate/guanylate cyclase domain-containing protein [Acidimicrobiia bacterium]
MAGRTEYARIGDASVAYQVVGDGNLDLVFVPEWMTHLELQWQEPACARFLERLASFARLILFDKRGVGLSDPIAVGEGSGLDPWMDDVNAVLDHAKSQRAAFVGTGAGGPMTMLYAASHPERVSALVCCNTGARFMQTDDYPYGAPAGIVEEAVQYTRDTWGSGQLFPMGAPSLATSPAAREFHARFQRQAAGPGVAAEMQRMVLGIDVRPILSSIQVPTLVVHRAEDALVDVAHGRYLAEHIPGATYVELPGEDHLYFAGDAGLLVQEIQTFVTGKPVEVEPDRVLATVLFTDIVGSTDRAVELGDRRWRDLLDRHDALVREQLMVFRGREIDTAGDGFFATFDGPARALRAACAIRDAVRTIGLDIRVGVHTGEVDVRGDTYSGIGVHIGARVGALAEAGEVLTTKTVADLVAGSGIAFADRGTHRLKGVPDDWQLMAVAGF